MRARIGDGAQSVSCVACGRDAARYTRVVMGVYVCPCSPLGGAVILGTNRAMRRKVERAMRRYRAGEEWQAP